MNKTRILLLSKKHLLSTKLYEFLKRDYFVSLFNLDDVVKNRQNQYIAMFYGIDHIIFTTEFLWDLYSLVDDSSISEFCNKLFSISCVESIKITYISMDMLYIIDFMKMTKENKNSFYCLANFVHNSVESLDLNHIINISSVYGICEEDDVVSMIINKELEVKNLKSLEAPILADKVVLYVVQNIDKKGSENYPNDKKFSFSEWFDENYNSSFSPRATDSLIRFHQEHCVFEFVYKKEADSYYRNESVAEKRIEIGKKLANNIPDSIRNNLDFITPVPRTGLYYAMGLAEGLNKPYRQVLIKQNYSERSFSLTSIDDRKKFLWKKIVPIPELIKGKNIAIVDEAIFTGTTLKIVCEMLWNCDVNSIYLFIPTPPCRYHCNYLVHPPRKMLLEYMSQEYLKEYFNVNDIIFQDEDSFKKFNECLDTNVCLECFYGVNNYE